MNRSVEVRRLAVGDVGLIRSIDRSEHVDRIYSIVDGTLAHQPNSHDVPSWGQKGDGPFTVAVQIRFCTPIIARGAAFLGAFDGDALLGVTIVEPSYRPSLAWLAYLHVTRSARGRGVASALWTTATHEAATGGASAMYVSATPTGSAVGFYLSRGCVLASPVDDELHALEPDDIHFTCRIA